MKRPADPSHVFDNAIALTPTGPDTYQGRTSPAYGNMVGPFGGVIGATLLNAIMSHPQRLGDPVSLTVHYAAPIADGGFTVKARAVRTNRRTQHWLVELEQATQVITFATAVTAVKRETWSALDTAIPAVPPPAAVAPRLAHPEVAWTGCYEMRFIDGLDGAAAPEAHPSRTRLWIRDQPARPLDYFSLAAICDAFFPRIYVRRPGQVPAGTVALTTYFHADPSELDAQGTEPVLGVARGGNFGKGFFDQDAEIWSTSHALLATSHQIVYFKE
ncbi:MAG: acyl-CoA thioesterase [Pseudomonadota bacterium]